MKKTTRFTSKKGTLNKFCKRDFLKAKLNNITIDVHKIIFEAYLFANMHIVRLLREKTHLFQDRIIRGHRRGPVKEIKEKLKLCFKQKDMLKTGTTNTEHARRRR
jgi:hypothetical protein